MPATAEELDAGISELLARKVDGDYELASKLFEFWKNQSYRLMGYRSVAEYLRERWKGQAQDEAARMHARGFQRLIREYRLAVEIPLFRAAFDLISRSNRRLIAQVITPENAEQWIAQAKTLTYRELEELLNKVPEDKKNDGLVWKKLRLYPGQVELLERALVTAGRVIEGDGADPKGAESARLELVCQEFLATYETPEDGYRKTSTFECPRCGVFTTHLRVPGEDRPDGEGKMIVFQCSQCKAGLVVKAF